MSLLRSMAVGVVLSVIGVGSAQAVVITADFNTAGDGFITRDLDNGLEWLDVSTTVNVSINDAISTYSAAGFRLATDLELISLYVSSGIDEVLDMQFDTGVAPVAVVGSNTNFQNVTSALGRSALTNLYNMMGGGASNFGGNTWIHGYLSDHDLDGVHGLGRFITNSYSAHVNTNRDGWRASRADTRVGSFLVRDFASVPEPTALALMGIGLVGMGFARKKKAA